MSKRVITLSKLEELCEEVVGYPVGYVPYAIDNHIRGYAFVDKSAVKRLLGVKGKVDVSTEEKRLELARKIVCIVPDEYVHGGFNELYIETNDLIDAFLVIQGKTLLPSDGLVKKYGYWVD